MAVTTFEHFFVPFILNTLNMVIIFSLKESTAKTLKLLIQNSATINFSLSCQNNPLFSYIGNFSSQQTVQLLVTYHTCILLDLEFFDLFYFK